MIPHPPLPHGAILFARVRPERLLFASLVELLARHPPFSNFALGLLVARLKRQLEYHSGVVALQNNRAIAYFGGIQIKEQDAEAWLNSRGAFSPNPDWESGTAMLITIVVTDKPQLLRPMARRFASYYPGHRGYWKRIYSDDRPDSWRVPYRTRRS